MGTRTIGIQTSVQFPVYRHEPAIWSTVDSTLPRQISPWSVKTGSEPPEINHLWQFLEYSRPLQAYPSCNSYKRLGVNRRNYYTTTTIVTFYVRLLNR